MMVGKSYVKRPHSRYLRERHVTHMSPKEWPWRLTGQIRRRYGHVSDVVFPCTGFDKGAARKTLETWIAAIDIFPCTISATQMYLTEMRFSSNRQLSLIMGECRQRIFLIFCQKITFIFYGKKTLLMSCHLTQMDEVRLFNTSLSPLSLSLSLCLSVSPSSLWVRFYWHSSLHQSISSAQSSIPSSHPSEIKIEPPYASMDIA